MDVDLTNYTQQVKNYDCVLVIAECASVDMQLEIVRYYSVIDLVNELSIAITQLTNADSSFGFICMMHSRCKSSIEMPRHA